MNRRLVDRIAGAAAVLAGQVIHRELDAAEVSPFDRQVARAGRAAAQAHCVKVVEQLPAGSIDPDVGLRDEFHAFCFHLREPAVEVAFLHLEVGNSVTQQPADPVGPLVDRHRMAGAGELLGTGKPAGPEPTIATLLAGRLARAARA